MAPLPKRKHSTQRKGKRRAARVVEFLKKHNIPLRKRKNKSDQ